MGRHGSTVGFKGPLPPPPNRSPSDGNVSVLGLPLFASISANILCAFFSHIIYNCGSIVVPLVVGKVVVVGLNLGGFVRWGAGEFVETAVPHIGLLEYRPRPRPRPEG